MGEVYKHVYGFKNTGNKAVEIEFVSGECTCTEADDWTKGIIEPGAKGQITLIYDPAKKEGEYGPQWSGATIVLTYRDEKGYPTIYSIKFRSEVVK